MSVKLHFCNNSHTYVFFLCSWTIMWRHHLQHFKAYSACHCQYYLWCIAVIVAKGVAELVARPHFFFIIIQHNSTQIENSVHSKSFWTLFSFQWWMQVFTVLYIPFSIFFLITFMILPSSLLIILLEHFIPSLLAWFLPLRHIQKFACCYAQTHIVSVEKQ